MDELGSISATNAESAFTHIPDWYAWQRKCVREQIESGEYKLETPVRILMGVDTKHIYDVGEGVLTHSAEGFHLVGCDGELDYTQKVQASYSLYSDFNWYEVGDVICIGNSKALYYCLPQDKNVSVAKVRIAAEELYKYKKNSKKD
jgi:hypothetical protein